MLLTCEFSDEAGVVRAPPNTEGLAGVLVVAATAGTGFFSAVDAAGFLEVSTEALTLALLAPESANKSLMLIYQWDRKSYTGYYDKQRVDNYEQ